MKALAKKFITDLLEDLEGAFATNTLRAYEQDFEHVCVWSDRKHPQKYTDES